MTVGTDAPMRPGGPGGPGGPGYPGGPVGRDRLPVAPRQRRPALAILAVLLILVGGLASALLVMRTSQQATVVVAARDLPAGQKITADDIKQARLGGDTANYVGWADRNTVLGNSPKLGIPAGAPITSDSLTKGSGPTGDQAQVGLKLTYNQAPVGTLAENVHVKVLYTPSDSGTSKLDAATRTALGTTGVVADDATVTKIRTQNDGSIFVTLTCSTDDAAMVSKVQATGSISLIVIRAS
jgi:Flp pilus assembly protein CpaB